MNKRKPEDIPRPKGTLLIIGGHENKTGEAASQIQEGNKDRREILEAFIELTKKKNPYLEIITTASTEGTESFKEYKKAFGLLGVTKLGHIHHAERSEVINEELAERINKADGFFFTGGNQLKLTSVYGGTEFLLMLKNRYIKQDIIVAGTSAGAMAFSTPMIYAGSKEMQQITGEVKVTTGLEFLKNVCIDTHFVDRSRFVRISQVIATNPSCIGIGIEEDTAVVVTNGIEAEIIGSGVVIIIEGYHLTTSNVLEFGKNQALHIENLTVHLLSKGCTYCIPE